jgi:hypothetical protein
MARLTSVRQADAKDEAKLFYHTIDLDPDFAPA